MKKAIVWVLGILGALITLIVFWAIVASLLGGISSGSVIHFEISAQIPESLEGPALFAPEPQLALAKVARGIRSAAEDDAIVGLVLDIKASRVGFAQLQEIEEAMATFREAGKWSAAFLETAGELSRGDGAYALALTAGEVILAPPGDLNLVGLRAEVPFLKGTLDKLELGVHVKQRHAYKNAANSLSQKSFTPEHEEAVTHLLNDVQNLIVDHIATRRGLTPDEVRGWIGKGPYSAQEAEAAGMVDELGYWDAILAKIAQHSPLDEPLVPLHRYVASTQQGPVGEKLAIIIAEGPITRGRSNNGFGDTSVGSDTLSKALREARKAEVKGVLIRVNSPGGSYVASDLIRREVFRTRTDGIPVVVSMGDVAASGGYFVAMDADRIIAQPGTLTGSIGVYAGSLSTRSFFRKKLGITFDSYQTSPAADLFSNLDPPSPEHDAELNTMLDRIYADFVAKAAKGRGMTPEAMDAVAKGRVWTGREALEHGLVDELGGLELAKTRVKELAGLAPEADAYFEVFPKPKSDLEMLFEALGSAGAAAQSAAQTLSEVRGATGTRGVLYSPLTLRP